MAKMSEKLPHKLARQDAQVRVRGFLSGLKGRFAGKISDLEENWDVFPHTFKFKVEVPKISTKIEISGTLQVLEREVQLEAEIPWLAKKFYGDQIIEAIQAEGRKLLA